MSAFQLAVLGQQRSPQSHRQEANFIIQLSGGFRGGDWGGRLP